MNTAYSLPRRARQIPYHSLNAFLMWNESDSETQSFARVQVIETLCGSLLRQRKLAPLEHELIFAKILRRIEPIHHHFVISRLWQLEIIAHTTKRAQMIMPIGIVDDRGHSLEIASLSRNNDQ